MSDDDDGDDDDDDDNIDDDNARRKFGQILSSAVTQCNRLILNNGGEATALNILASLVDQCIVIYAIFCNGSSTINVPATKVERNKKIEITYYWRPKCICFEHKIAKDTRANMLYQKHLKLVKIVETALE